jgi:hypothetical protein
MRRLEAQTLKRVSINTTVAQLVRALP